MLNNMKSTEVQLALGSLLWSSLAWFSAFPLSIHITVLKLPDYLSVSFTRQAFLVDRDQIFVIALWILGLAQCLGLSRLCWEICYGADLENSQFLGSDLSAPPHSSFLLLASSSKGAQRFCHHSFARLCFISHSLLVEARIFQLSK